MVQSVLDPLEHVCVFVQVDLEFLDEVISEGADPNSSDRYGQTILHEVSTGLLFEFNPQFYLVSLQTR